MGAISTAFVQQYKDNIIQLVQQRMTKLRSTVMVDTDFTGEFKFYDQLGSSDMVERTGRNQDTPSIDPDHRRRRLGIKDFVHARLLDKEDVLRVITDPKSAYSISVSMAAGRKIDDVIIAAYIADAQSGKTGSTTTTFDSNFKIAVAGAGLTKNKLIEAKELLDDEDVDDDNRFCVVTPRQISDLLKTTEVTSTDFNTVKALISGELNTWLGFKFARISSKRLPVISGTTDRAVYCYHRGAIQLGIQKEPSVRVDERPDKNYAFQVFLAMSMNATRLEEERIVQIACQES